MSLYSNKIENPYTDFAHVNVVNIGERPMKWKPHIPRDYSVLEPLITARFWSKVDVPEAKGFRDTCWNWRRAKDKYGYGQFKPMSYVPPLRSHRVAWEIVNGPVPDGLLILHSCNNPACCNPAHLRPGTHQENMDDKKRPSPTLPMPA